MTQISLLWCSLSRRELALSLTFLLAIITASTPLSASESPPLNVTITSTGDSTNLDPTDFFELALVLALEKTRQSDGNYVLHRKAPNGGIARDRAMLIAGTGLDVMWGSVTQDRLASMRLVPFDLLKGLNNYRALLIHKDSQEKFAAVKSLADLKRFSAGSGDHWTDGLIFKNNDFTLSFTSNYYSLYKMLAAKRFDFISRGLQEIDYDIQTFQHLGLVAEQNLLLTYSEPVQYSFFVNKKNTALGDRIYRGLIAAQEDGSFDELFFKIPSHKAGDKMLRSTKRTIIKIDNSRQSAQ